MAPAAPALSELMTASRPDWPKTATGAGGAVAAGSPHAARAGAEILRIGGNAVDAAVATCFALTVTDPANAGLAGRCHILIRLADGRTAAIDGATQIPAGTPPLAGDSDKRTGFATVPIPGNPAALASAVAGFGRLPLKQVVAAAIDLAENGFELPHHLAAVCSKIAPELSTDPAAARFLLAVCRT